jgi:hypothetical protein
MASYTPVPMAPMATAISIINIATTAAISISATL